MFPLETYLLTVNERQGIGFKIFSVVVDKRLLKQLALTLGGGLSTGLTFLLSQEAEGEAGSVADESCDLSRKQVATIVQAAFLDRDASCYSNITLGALLGP